jgi:hypothetical protein
VIIEGEKKEVKNENSIKVNKRLEHFIKEGTRTSI